MKYAVVPLAFTLLLTACGGQTSTTPPAGNTAILTISGQVQNWQSSYGSTLLANTPDDEFLGSGSIDASGNFSVNVSPPVFSLRPIAPCESTNSTVVSTPDSLRTSYFILGIAGQDVSLVERLDAEQYTNRAIYIYADRPGTVQGQVRCDSEYFNSLVRYNLTLVEGWNLVNINFQDLDDATGISTWTSATEATVSSYSWYASIFK